MNRYTPNSLSEVLEEEAPGGRCTCGALYVNVYGSGDLGCEQCWSCADCGTTLTDDEGQCPACHADDYDDRD